MATFPKSEAEILILAIAMEGGFAASPMEFPSLPIDGMMFSGYRSVNLACGPRSGSKFRGFKTGQRLDHAGLEKAGRRRRGRGV